MSEGKVPAKEIGELLDMVSQKLPGLIKGVMATFYTEEAAANLGKAIGTFYRQLVDNGFPNDHAMALTVDYMKTLMSIMQDLNISNQ